MCARHSQGCGEVALGMSDGGKKSWRRREKRTLVNCDLRKESEGDFVIIVAEWWKW